MNDATLQHFRDLADAMGCNQPRYTVLQLSQFTGKESPVVFGLTREKAENAAKFYERSRVVTDEEALRVCRTR